MSDVLYFQKPTEITGHLVKCNEKPPSRLNVSGISVYGIKGITLWSMFDTALIKM